MNGNSSSQTIQKKELCQVFRGCSGKCIEIIRPKAFNKLNKWQKHFPLLCVMGVRVRSVLQHSRSLPSCCCYSHTWGRTFMKKMKHSCVQTFVHLGQHFPLGLDGQCHQQVRNWTQSDVKRQQRQANVKCSLILWAELCNRVCNRGIYTQRANGAILAVSHQTPCQVSSSLIMI